MSTVRALGMVLLAAALLPADAARAQFEAQDVIDAAGILSLEEYNGRPTLIAKPHRLPVVLDQLQAEPIDPSHYKTNVLGYDLVFEVAPHGSPGELLKVLCEDDELGIDPCPDVATITYDNRGCYRDQGESSNVSCRLIDDPNDPNFGRYLDAWDPPKDRCRLRRPNEVCTEYRAVAWHFQYYLDPCCTQEVPGTHMEKTGLRCLLCR